MKTRSFLAGLCAVIALTVFQAKAQNEVVNNPDNRAKWGLRASLDVSNPGDLKLGNVKVGVFKSGVGFSLGGYYNIPIVANLYWEPGVSIFYDTYRIDDSIMAGDNAISLDGHIDKFGMRLPLDFGYHFDIWEKASLFLKTGPQLSVGFTEKAHLKNLDAFEIEDNDLYSEEGGVKRFDILWDVAAGLDFSQFNVSLEYNFGLLNLLKDTEGLVSYKENYFRIGFGYSF